MALGSIRGDKFTPVDTLELQQVEGSLPVENNLDSQGSIHQVTSSHQMKQVSWQFPANATPGMYRLVFGQTAYAKVMGEPPQQLDFIFNKGDIVFWASWCPHCVELLPRIKTWLRQFNPGNFEIIAISLDTSEREWKNAVAEAGFEEFYNLSDLKMWDGKVAKDYNIFATPTMFLIDANRKILAKPETFEELLENADR